MAASYHRLGRNDPAVFELFVRKLPPHRDWLVVCGLGPTLRLITEMRFGPAELEYLGTLGYNDEFLSYLEGFRFSGDIEAMPEGTIAFPDEPLIRVTAPLIDAQLLETLLLNQINFQTMIATKAARIVLAADGKGESVIDFSPQARSRGRRRDEGRPRLRDRRTGRDLQRGGRDAVRVGARGHDGALLRAQLRERGGGVRGVHEGEPGQLPASGRHLRHDRGRAPGDRGVTPHGAPADRHPHRLGGPGSPRPRGPAPARRGRTQRGGDRRLRRPGGAPHRRALPCGDADRSLGRRHRAGDQSRLAGRERRLQARRRAARWGMARGGQALRGQGHAAGRQAGLQALRGGRDGRGCRRNRRGGARRGAAARDRNEGRRDSPHGDPGSDAGADHAQHRIPPGRAAKPG